jgi:hypothetical protein
MIISGSFVYQPAPSSAPATGTVLIALVVLGDDGRPVLPDGGPAPTNRIGAVAVLGYPQSDAPAELMVYPTSELCRDGYVLLSGNFDPIPPAGWMPAAILVYVHDHPAAIVTAAAPAVPNSSLVQVTGSAGGG